MPDRQALALRSVKKLDTKQILKKGDEIPQTPVNLMVPIPEKV